MRTNPIERARRTLQRRGWSQGRQFDKSGSMCILGALSYVGLRGVENKLARNLIRQVANEQFPQVFGIGGEQWVSVEGFNDWCGRTLDEVDLVLQKAAVRWDELV